MRVIANGSTADQYQDRPAGVFVLAKGKISLFTAVSLYSCIRIISIFTGRCSLFRFSTIIYLLTSYCK